ncbi:hypothetical protein BG015_001087, partial [Linnemannia schmuckeri]
NGLPPQELSISIMGSTFIRLAVLYLATLLLAAHVVDALWCACYSSSGRYGIAVDSVTKECCKATNTENTHGWLGNPQYCDAGPTQELQQKVIDCCTSKGGYGECS